MPGASPLDGLVITRYRHGLLTNRIKVQGFIVSEHMQLWPQALAELAALTGIEPAGLHRTLALTSVVVA